VVNVSDDDWFERALSEQESADADEEVASDDESDAGADSAEPDQDAPADATAPDERADAPADAGGRADETDDGDPPDDPGAFGGSPGDERDSPTGMSPSDGDAVPGAGGDDPFAEDFETAFQNAPEPAGPSEGAGAGDDDFGFGDFGGGGGGSFGETDFDEAEYDSDIDRIEIGIDGLDEMILGGVPERSLMVVIGSAGTGKTTFGLQFLRQALLNDEKAVYISLEESREQILSTAEDKGWSFEQYADEERLAIVDLDPIEMANSLSSIRNDLPRLIDDFGADRLVLDSVSLLEMMYDNTAARRSEVFDFTRSLKQAGVTTMLTSEANEDNAYASRHGIVEYLTDAVFVLQYVRPSDFRETRLAVEIQKIRDANHSRETKPYEITNDGISVYRQANIF
jgi:KaiC domain protein